MKFTPNAPIKAIFKAICKLAKLCKLRRLPFRAVAGRSPVKSLSAPFSYSSLIFAGKALSLFC